MSSNRSHLKKWILVQGQGGAEFQPAGILKYVEELERGPNTGIPKGYIYAAMAFSAFIEGLNMMSRRARRQKLELD